VLLAEMVDNVNRYMIPQLVAINFPQEFTSGIRARMVSRGFSSLDQSLMVQLVQLVGQADTNELSMVDIRQLLTQYGVPTLSPSDVQKKQTEALALQQASLGGVPQDGTDQPTSPVNDANKPSPKDQVTSDTPPGGTPVPGAGTGGTGDKTALADTPGHIKGVTDEKGRYVKHRERIVLADDRPSFTERIARSVPDFEDDSVLKPAEQVQSAWKGAYAEAYADIAREIAASRLEDDLALGPFDLSAKFIQRVGEAAAKSYAKVSAKTIKLLVKLMQATARKEAQKLGFDPNVLGDFDEAQFWAEARIGEMLPGVTETTTDEIKTFLVGAVREGQSASQIAKAVEDHFAPFAAWKSERLAYAESRTALAAAQLLAARSLGVTHVTAMDASDGTDHDTDQRCIARHGKVFELDQAMTEMLDSHPNCTLHFRLIPPTHDDRLAAAESTSWWRKVFSRRG
jgi:hypothetical protein